MNGIQKLGCQFHANVMNSSTAQVKLARFATGEKKERLVQDALTNITNKLSTAADKKESLFRTMSENKEGHNTFLAERKNPARSYEAQKAFNATQDQSDSYRSAQTELKKVDQRIARLTELKGALNQSTGKPD